MKPNDMKYVPIVCLFSGRAGIWAYVGAPEHCPRWVVGKQGFEIQFLNLMHNNIYYPLQAQPNGVAG